MSSNKKKTPLLNETMVRRWGTLANIPALTSSFLKERKEEDDEEEEEEGKKREEESKHREEEGKKMEDEGRRPSNTPVKQGGNKTLAEKREEEEEGKHREEESKHREEEGKKHEEEGKHREEESIMKMVKENPMDDEGAPPEAPVGEPPPDHKEPDGDEGGMGEPMVQDLVKAIADAISAQTGVQVAVAGGEGGQGSMPPSPEDQEDEMTKTPNRPMDQERMEQERKGHLDHSGATYINGQPQNESKKVVKEDFSEAPQVTKQNSQNQGSVKDNTKEKVRVKGVEKPDAYLGKTTAGYPHHMKTMEEQLMKRVLSRLLQEIKKGKSIQETKKTVKK